ncbi:hypothetical protein A8C32_18710 [Flavivirga aquatica]|uniref:Uncharacterized protein n=1 Tax=Flavivirga aquatica TaxID=1849968 RepID=A0A1E5T3V6_9FLAO|nr:hypothetical protein [Flavivirga aquatica]OEK06064.1 hypothetical protein A8C32_18710 [Flavivirga aquatica]
MTQVKKSILLIKKISDGVYNFVDKFNDDTLYIYDFEDVKLEYEKVLKIYNNNSEAISLKDFSKNYAFSFYMKKNLLDYQNDSKKMIEETHKYLIELREKGDI